MVFVILLIALLYFVKIPKALNIFFMSPIIGFLSGSVFWGISAIITERVKSFEIYLLFVIVTGILYALITLVED